MLAFRLYRWNMTFLDTEMQELGRSIQITTRNTRLLIRTPQVCSGHRCRRKKPLRWNSLNTHTHTHTHTHRLLSRCSISQLITTWHINISWLLTCWYWWWYILMLRYCVKMVVVHFATILKPLEFSILMRGVFRTSQRSKMESFAEIIND